MNREAKLRKEVEPHRRKIELYRFKGIQYLLKFGTLEFVELNFLLECPNLSPRFGFPVHQFFSTL